MNFYPIARILDGEIHLCLHLIHQRYVGKIRASWNLDMASLKIIINIILLLILFLSFNVDIVLYLGMCNNCNYLFALKYNCTYRQEPPREVLRRLWVSSCCFMCIFNFYFALYSPFWNTSVPRYRWLHLEKKKEKK